MDIAAREMAVAIIPRRIVVCSHQPTSRDKTIAMFDVVRFSATQVLLAYEKRKEETRTRALALLILYFVFHLLRGISLFSSACLTSNVHVAVAQAGEQQLCRTENSETVIASNMLHYGHKICKHLNTAHIGGKFDEPLHEAQPFSKSISTTSHLT